MGGRHAQQALGGLEEDGPRDAQGVGFGVLALGDFFGEDLGHLFAHEQGLGVSPFHDIGVGEEADLLVDGDHVEALGQDVPDGGREEVVPPESGQAEIGQLAAKGTQGLVGMPAGDEALEPQLRVAPDQFGQLGQGVLGDAAGRLEGQRFGSEAELEDDQSSFISSIALPNPTI